MFERLKRTLVESYVGAIALGYLLAQVILHFVEIFASPVAVWVRETIISQSYRVPLLRQACHFKMHCPNWRGSLYFFWCGISCCAGSTSNPSKKKHPRHYRIQ